MSSAPSQEATAGPTAAPKGPEASAIAAALQVSSEMQQQPALMEIDGPGGTGPAATAEDWRKALSRVVPAVVVLRITSPKSFDTESANCSHATGIIVDKRRGLILTNRHVIKPGPAVIEAVFLNREEIPVHPLYRDPVHDFGFLHYDPSAVHFMEYEEIQLAPEAAAVGLEIRVVGNDSGEKMSILAGTLARLDRDAPQYKKDGYNDFNTFYMQAASGTKGGSSGSPVIDCQGRAIAMNAGSKNSGSSAYYLPLDRVVRAMEILQRGKEPGGTTWMPPVIPRGTLQMTLLHKGFDETRRLGLRVGIEQKVREASPAGETGMLVVESAVPGGPAYGHLEPGDVLVHVNGKVVTQFLDLETTLDQSVGRPISLEVERGGKLLSVSLTVQDLHAITPSSFVELSGGVIHSLSYQQARNFRFECGLVYVAEPGYMLSRAGVPKHAIIKTLAGQPTPRMENFLAVYRSLPRGARVPIEFYTHSDRHRVKSVLATIDRHEWYARPEVYTRDDSTGLWQVSSAFPPPPRTASLASHTSLSASMDQTLIKKTLLSETLIEDAPRADGASLDDRTGGRQGGASGDGRAPPGVDAARREISASGTGQAREGTAEMESKVSGTGLRDEGMGEGEGEKGWAGEKRRRDETEGAIEGRLVGGGEGVSTGAEAGVGVSQGEKQIGLADGNGMEQPGEVRIGENGVRGGVQQTEVDVRPNGEVALSPPAHLAEHLIEPALVMFDVHVPPSAMLDGVHAQHFSGTGLIVHHSLSPALGLVAVDRNTVAISVSDVMLSFAAYPIEIPGEVVFLHPLHNYALVAYDPRELGAAGAAAVRAASLLPDVSLRRGDPVYLVGLSRSLQVTSRRSMVTNPASALEIGRADSPRFRAINEEVIEIDTDFGTGFSGALADERGRIYALYSSFSTQVKYADSGAEDHQFVKGMAIGPIWSVVQRIIDGRRGPALLINGVLRPMPSIRVLEAEMHPILLTKARSFGLSEAWVQTLARKDPKRRQVLRVKGMLAGSRADKVLEIGDMLLAIGGQPITSVQDVEVACQRLDAELEEQDAARWRPGEEGEGGVGALPLTILRQGREIQISVGTDVRDGLGTTRMINWAGCMIQAPHVAVRALGFLPPKGHGTYIARWCHGSPAHRYGLYALHWIVEINGQPTPDIEAFLDATKGLEHGAFVRVKTMHLNGKPRVLTLKQDLHYWPTWELRFDPATATWRRTILKGHM